MTRIKVDWAPVRYVLLTYRLDQLWLPGAFWALFAVMVGILYERPDTTLNIARAFLGFVLPLIAGILAAYAVLDDPALELHFASPRPAWRTLLGRLGVILVVVCVAALSFELFLAIARIDVSVGGNLAARQLVWLIPSLALMALGSAASMLFAQSTLGAVLAGLVWLIQLLLRNSFMDQPLLRPIFLFMRALAPTFPSLFVNQACLLGLSVLLLVAAAVLLKKEERFI